MNIWNEAIWKEINDEIRKVAGTIRVAQKVFPTIILDNPSNIPDDTFDLTTFTIPEGLTKPFVEISEKFSLTPNQVAYESSLHAGLKLAKVRAADLARIEDLILFQGNDAFPQPAPRFPPGVNVRNLTTQSVGTGLLGLATPRPPYVPPNAPIPVKALYPPQTGVIYGTNTVNAVVQGISLLNGQSQPGPYALILDYGIVTDTYSVLGGTVTTAADLITPLVTRGVFGTAALGPFTGLLVSLGGEPATLSVGVEATTAFTFVDQQDNYSFRVFERVQFDARDARAFVRLNFIPPKPIISKIEPNTGNVRGGEPIAITGGYFESVSSVDFGGKSVRPPYEFSDDTHITLKSPAHGAGKVDVKVTTPRGTSDPTPPYDQFTYI